MKTVMNDMDANEREAIKTGSRKRKAPAEDTQGMFGSSENLQRKKVNAKAPVEDDEAEEDFKAMRQMVKARAQRNRP